MIKTQKVIFGAILSAVFAATLGSSSAFAGNIDLINAALNNSLEEKAKVTAEYTSNEAAERPDNHFENRARSERMELSESFLKPSESKKSAVFDQNARI